MSGDGPVIKFSPFEALLIGEHNSIIKRKPMKNAVYLTNLNNRRKEFNLRELFDVKEWSGEQKKIKKIKRYIEKESNFHSLRVRQNKKLKAGKRNKKKNQPNKVRFKPDFRFRETLEERIVQKIQKRKKKPKTNLVGNGVMSQMKKPNPNRHSLRGKNGQFIRKEDSGNAESNRVSSYLKNMYKIKKEDKPKTERADSPESPESEDRAKYYTESVLNDISLQYYRNVFPEQFGYPLLPEHCETIDFDEEDDFRGARDESRKDNDEDSNPSGDYTEFKRKGLRRYERKKTDKNEAGIFGKKAKENHFVNKSTKPASNSVKSNAITTRKRNGVTCLIDERPAKSNQLIWNNKFRSLFYKTAFGSELYLGNSNKALVLNSTFGRLTDQ